MKNVVYVLLGVLFGIILTKSEAVSWFRIQEMFRFQSFHMYGIIGSAVMVGALSIQAIKWKGAKDFNGKEIELSPKKKLYRSAIIGGTIFGLGWALAGACPGPFYILLGNGYWTILIPLVSAVFGTFLYGVLKNRLPH